MFWLNPFQTLLNRLPRSRAQRRQAARRRRPLAPPCELLEDRCLLTNLGDLLLTINNPTPAVGDNFGSTVAAVGNNILVGAPSDDTGATDSGAVYLYDGTTGTLLLTINNPTPALGDRFGSTVAAVGNNILVGAPSDDTGATDSGAVYLFNGTTGALLQTINNPTPAAGDSFGTIVTAAGSNILVGAPLDDTGATDSGSAYLFNGTTGALISTINNPTPAGGDQFGRTIAAGASGILVGAPNDDTTATNSGAAYLFDGGGGKQLMTINNPTPATDDQFGLSLTQVGSNLLIGAPFDGSADQGAAYLLDGTTGLLLRTIFNPFASPSDLFGSSVAAVGNNILFGVPRKDVGLQDTGVAYLFDGVSGGLMRTFSNPAPATGDQFGNSVSAVGNNILVGGALDDAGASDSGAAYLIDGATFDLPSGDGTNDVTLRRGGGGFVLELIDNNTGRVLDTQPYSSPDVIVVAGSVTENDILVLDPSVNGLPLNFDGRQGTNQLVVPLFNSSGMFYAPGLSGFLDNQRITFSNCAELELFGGGLILVTPRGADVLNIHAAEGFGGQPANIISGSSGGMTLTSIKFYDVGSLVIDTSRNDTRNFSSDRITVNGPGLIAQGLREFSLTTGLGNDFFSITSDTFQLPGSTAPLFFDSGDGIDQVEAGANANLTVNNSQVSNSAGGAIVFRGRAPERATLIGGADGNRLDAFQFPGPVTLDGGNGEDTLISGGQNDRLLGGDGDDSLNGGNGLNFMNGGPGDDTLSGGSANDTLFGGDGDDSLTGGSGNDYIIGGDGENFLDGGLGNDLLTSGSYDDDDEEFYPYGSGDNTMLGGVGNDTLYGGAGNDSLRGGTGNDILLAGDGDNTLFGETGNDTLEAGGGDDSINAGNGNNRIVAGEGKDTVISSTGADFINAGGGDDSVVAGSGSDTIQGGTGADTIDAGAGNDFITGGDGNDSILGGAGDDTIFGDGGNDFIDCGTGFDFFDGGNGINVILNGEDEEELTF